MNIKRRIIRPPVPKFNLNEFETNSLDLLPIEIQIKDSNCNSSILDNNSDTSSDDNQESNFNRKKLSAIVEEMKNQISLLGLNEDLLKIALQLLQPDLLSELRQKKYTAIAIAIAGLIAAIKQTSIPITQREILAKISVSEKLIKKILLKIHNNYKLEPVVQAFIKSISNKLGLNQRFVNFCVQVFNKIQQNNLIQGEHENVIAAAIVKYSGDIIFASRGGILSSVIAQQAKCSIGTFKMFHKKVMENQYFIMQTLKSLS
ncbi:unnamed protein product [Paramecium pentaurelia]|uniref:Uncharacterized protein n=1 Tax=Paramecium pentaurelia TaxID=43138 RepID=A0A8S1T3E4_9CILI|nr:unnamed protein product [Paramecium pentaurelia]